MTDKKPIFQRMKDGVRSVVEGVKSTFGFDFTAKFDAGASSIELAIDMDGDTVWATKQQIAALFGIDRSVVSKHIQSLFQTGEVHRDGSTCATFAQVRTEGERTVTRPVEHYSMDVILAVGFAVNGPKAIAFRKKANEVLKGFIRDGYALNGQRLDSDPSALLRLAEEVRAIRTSEKNLWAQVTETFALSAIDYDKNSDEARRFFSQAQDTMHYAATEKTASEIIVDRCDAKKPNMGLVALGNQKPTKADITVAKNYCPPEELRRMQLIGEAFLLYVEGLAEREKQVSMARLLAKFRGLVEFYDYPVFPGYTYRRPTAKQARDFAGQQYELFKKNGQPRIGPR